MNPVKDTFGTEHPVVVITGSGAPRIGHSVAKALFSQGYQVGLHAHQSIDSAREIARQFSDAGTPSLAVSADLRDEFQIHSMMDQFQLHFGRIDALINCAAIWESGSLEQTTADDVRRHFEVNTLATFLCSQSAARFMVNQKMGGAIINVGDWAIARPYLNYAAYFPSKGAIPTLTRNLAVELAARNPRIRVNAVLPGPVMLPPDLSTKDRRTAINGTLVKREGTPEHVANAITFLLQNDFITGVCLPVDGGRSIAS